MKLKQQSCLNIIKHNIKIFNINYNKKAFHIIHTNTINKNNSNKLYRNKFQINSTNFQFNNIRLFQFANKNNNKNKDPNQNLSGLERFNTNTKLDQFDNKDKSPRVDPEEISDTTRHLHENGEIQGPQDVDSEGEDQQSFYNQRRRMVYLLSTSLVIISGIYFGLHFLEPDKTVPLQKRLGEVTYIGKAEIGGPWQLFDTKGQVVNHKDLAGKYYLIYFGFTLCPDVCPQSLSKIAKVLKRIRSSQEYQYFDLETIFVSVDPDRDTYERIDQYCKIFDDKIIGLTGISNNHPDLKDMLRKFKIHSSKIYLSEEDEQEDKKLLTKNNPQVQEKMSGMKTKINSKYSLDHTIVTYLMGPDNNFITFLSANLDVDEMYNIVVDDIMHDLTKQMKSAPSQKR